LEVSGFVRFYGHIGRPCVKVEHHQVPRALAWDNFTQHDGRALAYLCIALCLIDRSLI